MSSRELWTFSTYQTSWAVLVVVVDGRGARHATGGGAVRSGRRGLGRLAFACALLCPSPARLRPCGGFGRGRARARAPRRPASARGRRRCPGGPPAGVCSSTSKRGRGSTPRRPRPARRGRLGFRGPVRGADRVRGVVGRVTHASATRWKKEADGRIGSEVGSRRFADRSGVDVDEDRAIRAVGSRSRSPSIPVDLEIGGASARSTLRERSRADSPVDAVGRSARRAEGTPAAELQDAEELEQDEPDPVDAEQEDGHQRDRRRGRPSSPGRGRPGWSTRPCSSRLRWRSGTRRTAGTARAGRSPSRSTRPTSAGDCRTGSRSGSR